MKLAFCPFLDLISADVQVVVDCGVKWELGTPKLRVDDVLEKGGKVSLFRTEDCPTIWRGVACLIAEMAEHDPELLDRAVEQDSYERAA